MNKTYSRINWQNLPSTATALSATNLNKIDAAVDTMDDRIIELDRVKTDDSVTNGLVRTVLYNTDTGVFRFIHVNGSIDIVDLNVEKIPASFYMDENGILYLFGADGKPIGQADIKKLVPSFNFNNTDTIGFDVESSTTGARNVSASVLKGSITAEHLEPGLMNTVLTDVERAERAANKSATYYTRLVNSQIYVDYNTGHLMFADSGKIYGFFDETGKQLCSWEDTELGTELNDADAIAEVLRNYPTVYKIAISGSVDSITTEWPNMLDMGLDNLHKLILPNSITTLPEEFLCNKGTPIVDLELPKYLEVIPRKAFYSMGLETVKLPLHCKSIEDSAFGYNDIVSLELPYGLEHIGNLVFTRCFTRGSELVIPETVNYIGKRAFYTSGLDTIIFEDPTNWYKVDASGTRTSIDNILADPYTASDLLIYNIDADSYLVKLS